MAIKELLKIIGVALVVSIFTVIIITTFDDSSLIEMEDEFTRTMLDVASEVETYWHTPAMYDGGDHSFEGADFSKINCPFDVVSDNNKECINTELGEKIILHPSPDSVLLEATLSIEEEMYTAKYTIMPNDIHLLSSWSRVDKPE